MFSAPDSDFRRSQQATSFAEFFDLGQQESVSPFLKPDSRKWSINLTLKASILAAFVLLLAFGLSFFSPTHPLSNLFLIFVYFLAGIPSLIEATEDLIDGEINIDILMTLAAFSSILIGSGMEGGLLLVLFALSGSMEDAVTTKAKGALSSLHKLSPTKACVVEAGGMLIEKAIKDIPLGTRILVKAGQIVPLDGIVVQGTSSVNLVHLTGENFPVTKTLGDNLPAGARNLEGALTIDVIRTSTDSTLTKIIQLVTEAQEARPILQRWFDKASRAYAMSIISLSMIFAFTLPWVLSIPFLGLEGSIYRSLAFLIAASPCALIIAIPIAYLSAVSICAKKGVLIKGGITLDALARCRAIAFDKTGTLTTGELSFIGLEPLSLQDNYNLTEALNIAYSLEQNTVHPIANALIKYAKSNPCNLIRLKNFKAIPGYGLEATAHLGDKEEFVVIGRPGFIAGQLPVKQQNLLLLRTQEIENEGELLAVLLVRNTAYILRFSDTPRPLILETLTAIINRGWEIIMLTGDHFSNAKRIAKELQIKAFYADLTPEDKLRHVTELSQRKGLAMIGDGINDAPALARATVGICMGKVGSTAAIDASDVVLLHDNIQILDWLIGKAKQTQSIVNQNLFLAIGAILIAAIPALGGLIPLWLAVVLHEGGTVLVGLNALRLLRD